MLQSDIETALKEHSITHLNPIIKQVFDNVAQNVSPKHLDHSGRVAINVMTVDNVDDFEERVMRRLPDTIRSLMAKGYRQKDIAFLVRTREEGRKIVELLLALTAEGEESLCDLRVVSDESLLISNAPPVKLIVGILRYLQNPSYPINELILSYEYGLMGEEQGVSPSQVLAVMAKTTLIVSCNPSLKTLHRNLSLRCVSVLFISLICTSTRLMWVISRPFRTWS